MALVACQRGPTLIDFDDPRLTYTGRMPVDNKHKIPLIWSGSSIKFNFVGTGVSALMQDQFGNNFYNVLVDGQLHSVIQPSTNKEYIVLAENLSDQPHSIEVYKRAEWSRGKTWFWQLKLADGASLTEKSPAQDKKIVFYGDSITTGYAVEDTSGKDSPAGLNSNNYLTYAALTARHFDAEPRFIAKSGIGVTISWFPFIMPEIYDLIDPTDYRTQWDFSQFQADIVVVNLMQNDSWLVNRPERAEFKANFGEQKPSADFIINAYSEFIQALRNQYPQANIICMLGNMDATAPGSVWPDYIKQAVIKLNDNNIFTYFQPYKNTDGHPSIAEHQEMANGLIEFINHQQLWNTLR